LNADQADQSSAAGSVNHPDDPVGRDASVIVGLDMDRHTGAEHLAPTGVFGETVEAGQGVRRDRGLDLLDWMPIVVVTRRLDQHHVEHGGIASGRRRLGETGQIDRFQLSGWARLPRRRF
jgi:hypothetical protein